MSLLRPEALVLLVLGVPIVLAYLVQPRRRRSTDPFFFLWVALAGPRRRRRLVRVLEVVLLLGALALLVGGVAGPGREDPAPPRRVRLVVVAGPAPRGGWQHREAVKLLRELGPAATGCLLVGGPEGPRVVVPPSPPPFHVEAAAFTREGQPDRAALRRAARALAAIRPGAEVHWIDDDPEAHLPPGWIRHRPAARPARVALELRRAGPEALQVRAVNAGPGTWQGTLTATAGGATRRLREWTLPAGGASTARVPLAPGRATVVALVRGSGGPVDAEAGYFLPRRRRVRIGVLARDGAAPCVGAMLRALGDRIDQEHSGVIPLTDEGLDHVARVQGSEAPFDLLVCRDVPVPWPPLAAPCLLFGGPGPLGTAAGPPATGGVAAWDRRHPLLRWVDLSPLVAWEFAPVEAASGVDVLAVGPAGPMLLYRPGPPPIVALPFRLERSRLPFLPAFTILVSNLIRIWGGEASAGGARTLGETFPLAPGRGVAEVARATDPGPVWRGRPGEGFPCRPRRPGLFEATGAGGRHALYFNPARARPAPLPGSVPAAPPAAAARAATVWTPYLAALVWAALVLLVVEWLVFRGRA